MGKYKRVVIGVALVVSIIVIIGAVVSFDFREGKFDSGRLWALVNENANVAGLTEGTENATDGNSDGEVSTLNDDRSIEEIVDEANRIGADVDTSKWDLTKVDIVYDKTGIPVPVPKGYTASSVESEMYVNGLNTIKTGTKTELEFSSEGDYPWTQNDDGVWVSGNAGVLDSTSTLVSNEFTVGENGGRLMVEWSVSCSYRYAYCYVLITNMDTGEQIRCPNIADIKYGTVYEKLIYTTCEKELSAGTYKVKIYYYKANNTETEGLDTGYVKGANILNYNDSGTDQVIEHNYGGFVIYKGTDVVDESTVGIAQKTRNQFVWIPVPDIDRIYEVDEKGNKKSKMYNVTVTGRTKRYNEGREPGVSSYDREAQFYKYKLQGMTQQKLFQEMQNEFEETIESISKYGGFWIGRYETGDVSKTVPVVQKMNKDNVSQNWYTMYMKLQRVDINENVNTSMIWGCLWDETCQWLVDSGRFTPNELIVSNTWGNYMDVELDYVDENGSVLLKKLGVSKLIPTGSSEYTNANNVYDIAGNGMEWLLTSAGGNGREIKGGGFSYYGSRYSASGSVTNFPNFGFGYYSSRCILYIK